MFHLCSAGSWYFVISECAPLRIWTVFFRINLLLINLLEKHSCLFRFSLAELLGGPFCFVCFQPDVPHRPPAPPPAPPQQQQNQQQLNPAVIMIVIHCSSVASWILLAHLSVTYVLMSAAVCIFLSACLMPITFLSACQPLCLSVNLSFHQFRFASVWQTLSVLIELFFLTDSSLFSLFVGLKWKVFDEASVSYRVQCLPMKWAHVIISYQVGLSSLSCSYFVVSFFFFFTDYNIIKRLFTLQLPYNDRDQ